MEFKNFIGIDISKDTVDLALLTEHGELFDFKWKNDLSVFLREFKSILNEYKLEKESTLFCAEHTGHYGNKLVDSALVLELNIWMESPYSILHSQGLIRGKNDKVDAIRIAEYAKRFVDKALLVKPTPLSIRQLKHLATERNLVLKDLSKYKAQFKQEEGFLEKNYFKTKEKRLKKIISTLEKTVTQIDEQMDLTVKNDSEIKSSFDKIVTIEGIGKQTAIATIVATNNFNRFDNPRKFACHIGCAPFRYQSGTSLHSRSKVSKKANKNLKKLFHMAAISTLGTTGELRQYYDRKVEEGKHKMSVINAIRSKLIHRIFVIIKEDRKYEKSYTHSLV